MSADRVASITAPVWKALADAKKPGGPGGAKITPAEAHTLEAAMDHALATAMDDPKLDANEMMIEVPASIGYGVMQGLKPDQFEKRRDFTKIRNAAATDVMADPNGGP